jgi:hypothetical protein
MSSSARTLSAFTSTAREYGADVVVHRDTIRARPLPVEHSSDLLARSVCRPDEVVDLVYEQDDVADLDDVAVVVGVNMTLM